MGACEQAIGQLEEPLPGRAGHDGTERAAPRVNARAEHGEPSLELAAASPENVELIRRTGAVLGFKPSRLSSVAAMGDGVLNRLALTCHDAGGQATLRLRLHGSAPAGGDTLATVDWSRYDFIDLGSSKGGSIEFCQKRFRAARGLGVDNDPDKVSTARARGAEVFLGDATRLPSDCSVRFVSMIDFLEHLPDLQTVESVLASAAEAASDFIFIRHPSFEGEGYLETLGFRQYWWNWKGHPVHPTVSDYCAILDRLGLRQYAIRYRELVRDSHHSSVLTTAEPPEQGPFDPARHAAKPLVPFAMPIWRSQDIFIALQAFDPGGADWRRITDVS